MARPRVARPVKLIVGLLAGDADLLRRAQQLLTRTYGPVDLESDAWPFQETDYYEAEMGPNLSRRFMSFTRLVRPDGLAEIKQHTNKLEEQIAGDCLDPDCPRPVNIDPGYVNQAKLVLATTKDRGHRIYLGLGIHAEVTLHFTKGAWQVQPWTYPDYRRPECHAFFERVRERYRQQCNELDDLLQTSGENTL